MLSRFQIGRRKIVQQSRIDVGRHDFAVVADRFAEPARD
jgi:hypothetical protein